MRLILLAAVFILAGCRGERQTHSAHAAVFGKDGEPVGHFTLSQTRWDDYSGTTCSASGSSEVELRFLNTSSQNLTFNFLLTGNGFTFRDAVIDLKPGAAYHNRKIGLRYNALDWWSLRATDHIVKP
jgi:hypothetical protein